MAEVLCCCFCKRKDSNLSTFKKIGGLTYCKNTCNRYDKNRKKLKAKHFNKNKQKLRRQKQQDIRVSTDDANNETLYVRRNGPELKRKSFKSVDDHRDKDATENPAVDCVSREENKRSNENSPVDKDVGISIMVGEEQENSIESCKVDDCGESVNGVKSEESQNKKMCNSCLLPNCSKSCSLCKNTFYCSKSCQEKDWPTHKEICIKGLTEEEKEIFKIYKEKKRQKEDYERRCTQFTEETDGLNNIMIDDSVGSLDGSCDRIHQLLHLQQAMVIATRPTGSLLQAFLYTKHLFPTYDIIVTFDDLPTYIFPFVIYPRGTRNVLLAFMYRFHENVMRHGIYLKDANDKKSKVEFCLDHLGDDPSPYFSYSQVKPGNYICLVDPVRQLFRDGTFGIRINDPTRVKILNI